MHRSSRAPVLSATRSRDSCWIMPFHPSLGFPHDLLQPPALQARDRPRLDDPHEVTDLRDVRLVVGVELGTAANDLLVARMQLDQVDTDDDRLVRRRGDDGPLPLLSAS